MDEDFRIIGGASKRLPGKIDTLQAVPLAVVGPTVEIKLIMVVGGLGKGWAIMRVALYRTLEQFERVLKPVSFPSRDVRSARNTHRKR